MKRLLVAAALAASVSASAQTVIYVDANNQTSGDGRSWDSAYIYLKDALNQASVLAGEGQSVQVWIADGVYLPDRTKVTPNGNGNPASTFTVADRVSLYGGFAGGENSLNKRNPAVNIAILHGDLLGDDGPFSGGTSDNSNSLLTIASNDVLTIIDGLTFTRGGAHLGVGGAARITDSPVEFTDCSFIRNGTSRVSYGEGGAIRIAGGSVSFLRCFFQGNRTGASAGAVYFNGSACTFRHCTFEKNSGDGLSQSNKGGAILVVGGAATIEDCVFKRNNTYEQGGAIWGSGLVVRRCTFESNNSEDGYGGAVWGDGSFEDCVFFDNRAFHSGAAAWAGPGSSFVNCFFGRHFVDHGRAQAVDGGSLFANCIFSRNYGSSVIDYTLVPSAGASIVGCTFYANQGTALQATPADTVTGSIFFANGSRDTFDQSRQISGTPQINHSFVMGLDGSLGGTGNIGAYPYDDPLFVDADGPDNIAGTADDNVRLRPGSPCIDAGNNNAFPGTITTDFDGLPRFHDDPGTVDTGYGSPPIVDMGPHEFQGTTCAADINRDGFVDGIDYDLFNNLFANGDLRADYNRDGFVDGIDYDEFNNDFEAGC